MKKLWLLVTLIAPWLCGQNRPDGDQPWHHRRGAGPQTGAPDRRRTSCAMWQTAARRQPVPPGDPELRGAGWGLQPAVPAPADLRSCGSTSPEAAPTSGTIAMARTQAVDSATCQFYFNLVDNDNLNANAGAGYTVFGQVVKGMEVLNKQAQVQTGYSSILRANDVPPAPSS